MTEGGAHEGDGDNDGCREGFVIFHLVVLGLLLVFLGEIGGKLTTEDTEVELITEIYFIQKISCTCIYLSCISSVLSVSYVVHKIPYFFSGSIHSISPTSFSISKRTLAWANSRV